MGKEILNKEEIKTICKMYELGASNFEVHYETGIDLDRIIAWRAIEKNDKMVEDLLVLPTWRAKKIFHNPKNHMEAEAVLKRHPASKKDYSDRRELTGEGGSQLIPEPILGGITKKNE